MNPCMIEGCENEYGGLRIRVAVETPGDFAPREYDINVCVDHFISVNDITTTSIDRKRITNV